MTFEHLSSHALTARLGELLATERRTIASFVLHLAELERRQLHLELGYTSTFVFCTQHLKLTNASAFRRTTAARLVTRYPAIAEMLSDGRLCLTTLAHLRDVLDDGNHHEVLDRAAGRTEDEVKLLVAALRPQPAPPDLFRRLPAPAPSTSDSEVRLFATTVPSPAGSPPTASPSPAEPPAPAVPPTPARVPALQPISEQQYVLRITVDRAFVDDLERLKGLLSHSLPDGNVTAVIHGAIRRTIAACEKQRRGSDRPRPRNNPRPPRGRAIPTEVRREVWERDAGACAFVTAGGERCGATHQVEFHHIEPAGRGGAATVTNVSLRCRGHNSYAADRDYGREFMNAARAGQRARVDRCDES